MTKDEKKQLFIYTIFNIGYTLASNFLSVYLFTYAQSLVTMTIYTIIRIGLFPPFFILGNKLTQKYPFSLTYTIGLTFITGSLIYALIGTPLFEMNGNYVLIAAAITGIGEGFYWYSSNTCNQIVASVQSRAKYLSWMGIFSSVVTISAPSLARILLQIAPNDQIGYRYILFVIIIAYVAVIFLAFTIRLKAKRSEVSILKVLSLKERKWRNHQLGVFFYGMRNSLALTLISILIYSATQSGKLYANLQIVFGLISIISYRLLTKLLDNRHLKQTFVIGSIISSLAAILLVIFNNMFGAVCYGLMAAVAMAMYDNSYNYISANIIAEYPFEMSERVVAREICLSVARCCGMGFVLLMYWICKESNYLIVAVLGLSVFPILCEEILTKEYLRNK